MRSIATDARIPIVAAPKIVAEKIIKSLRPRVRGSSFRHPASIVSWGELEGAEPTSEGPERGHGERRSEHRQREGQDGPNKDECLAATVLIFHYRAPGFLGLQTDSGVKTFRRSQMARSEIVKRSAQSRSPYFPAFRRIEVSRAAHRERCGCRAFRATHSAVRRSSRIGLFSRAETPVQG